jgi:transposase InsO family protein
MTERMQATLVSDALTMAVWKRKPAKGLIWHTNRGSQYTSDSHRWLLAQHAIVQNMSHKRDCWDNTVAESFFHSLKTELVYHETYPTHTANKQSIFKYIEVFYNRQRLHSNNDYLSPVDYELQRKAV